MAFRWQFPAYVVSTILHAAILCAFFFLSRELKPDQEPEFVIDTVVADENRETEEFQQELDTQETVATTLNVIAGSVSEKVGGSESRLATQQKIEVKDVVREPEIKLNAGAIDVRAGEIGQDLGEAEVTGEIGAVVEGYGAALDRLTAELLRMMRSQQLMVVWLFDESGSMKDDQQEIKGRIGRVYDELKLADKDENIQAVKRRAKAKSEAILLTAITSFGGSFHVHTQTPTNEKKEVVAAIDKIPVDETGVENMCASLLEAIGKYRGLSSRGGRKLVLIVVSDESGDDGERVEEVLKAAKTYHAPIYVLGREAVFGSLYAHVRWTQPQTGTLFYLPIRRGPETPYAEQLQHDGFRRRRDSQMSGFGPYEQVRLCRDTGGIFFQLPHEQADLNDLDDRMFQMLDLREYKPSLESRREYMEALSRSKFRSAIRDVVVMLNPYNPSNKGLDLPDREWFPVDPAASTRQVAQRLQQINGILGVLAAAQKHLEAVKPLRESEPSSRWRANYDLMVAQLFAYRVRLFEYAIALGQFAKTMPQRLTNAKNNTWEIRHGSSKLIMPDEAQQKALKVTAEELQAAHKQALEQFDEIQQRHPRTAWARRAEWEEKRQFGATFRDFYRKPPPPPDPNRKPPPKPPDPPKL